MALEVEGVQYRIEVDTANSQVVLGNFTGALGNTQKQLQTTQKTAQTLTQTVQGMMSSFQALAGIFAGRALMRYAANITLLAGRVENLATVMVQVGSTANISSGEMFAMESRMKSLGITTQVSRLILTRFAQNNLEVADSLRIARVAQDAAVVAGINSSHAAERMMVAVQRLDTRMLRNLGILINLRNEYQRYAITTGRVENSLTAMEKQAIVLNATLRAGASLAGAYEKAMEDVFKRFTSLERRVEEAQIAIGENFMPVLAAFVTVVEEVTDAITKWETVSTTLAVVLGGAVVAAVAAVVAGIGVLLLTLPALVITIGGWAFAIGMVLSLLVVLAGRQERLNKEMERNAEVAAFETVEISGLADEIERLNAIEDKTIDQQLKLAEAKGKLLNLLRDEEIAWLNAAHSEEEYVSRIRKGVGRGASGFSVGMSPLARRSEIQKRIEHRLEVIDALEEQMRSRPHERGVIDSDPKGRIKELRSSISELTLELEKLDEQIDANTKRRIQELQDQMDNLSTVTLQAGRSFDTLTKNRMLSEEASEAVENMNTLSEMSGHLVSLADLQKKLDIEILEAQKLRDERIKSAGDDQAAIAKAQLEFDTQRLTLIQAKTDAETTLNEVLKTRSILWRDAQRNLELSRFEQEKQSQMLGDLNPATRAYAEMLIKVAQTNKTLVDSQELLNRKMDTLKQAVIDNRRGFEAGTISEEQYEKAARDLANQLDILVAALEGEQLEAMTAVTQAYLDMAKAAEIDTEAIRELTREVEKLAVKNDLLAKGVDSGLIDSILSSKDAIDGHIKTFNNLREARERALEEGDQETVNKIEEAMRAHFDMIVEMQRSAEQRRTDITEEGAKKRADLEKKSIEDIINDTKNKLEGVKRDHASMVHDMLSARRATQAAIQRKQLDIIGAVDPGRAEALGHGLDLREEYLRLIQGAGSEDQLKKLKELFDLDVQRSMMGAQRAGNARGANIFGAFAQQQIAPEITRAIEEKRQELELQSKQLNELTISRMRLEHIDTVISAAVDRGEGTGNILSRIFNIGTQTAQQIFGDRAVEAAQQPFAGQGLDFFTGKGALGGAGLSDAMKDMLAATLGQGDKRKMLEKEIEEHASEIRDHLIEQAENTAKTAAELSREKRRIERQTRSVRGTMKALGLEP